MKGRDNTGSIVGDTSTCVQTPMEGTDSAARDGPISLPASTSGSPQELPPRVAQQGGAPCPEQEKGLRLSDAARNCTPASPPLHLIKCHCPPRQRGREPGRARHLPTVHTAKTHVTPDGLTKGCVLLSHHPCGGLYPRP